MNITWWEKLLREITWIFRVKELWILDHLNITRESTRKECSSKRRILTKIKNHHRLFLWTKILTLLNTSTINNTLDSTNNHSNSKLTRMFIKIKTLSIWTHKWWLEELFHIFSHSYKVKTINKIVITELKILLWTSAFPT